MDDSNDSVLWWTCPICGQTSANIAASNNTGAEGALRSHIYASAENGHGPRLAFPEELNPATLTDHISAKESLQQTTISKADN